MGGAATRDTGKVRAIRALSRDTLRDRVYDGLRAQILAGGFEPGEALNVRNLAAMFGTSPTPVREALQILVAERALSAEPNRSYRVPSVSHDAFIETRDMRAELEGLLAERAASRAGPAVLRRLEQAIARMTKAIDAQDRKSYLAANQSFHFTIYAAADAPIILATIGTLWLQIGPTLNMMFDGFDLVADLQDNHNAAVAALRAGDGEAARQAIRKDILEAGSFVGRRIATGEESSAG